MQSVRISVRHCSSSVIVRQRQRVGVLGLFGWRSIVLRSMNESACPGRTRYTRIHEQSVTRRSVVSADCGMWILVQRIFLPVGYPSSVRDSYTRFIRLNMAQVVFISLSRVLSTQAMLLAVGLGQGGALPIAAVMNWLLKDGLGHVGSILVGTSINTKFDSDPKRYKFVSVSLGQLANLFGILSLARPGMFLALTSLSSALSRVGTLAFTSSRARIYENFSAAGNIGDLMRCSQAQSTLATILGTGIGIAVAPIIGFDVTSILGLFVPVSAATHWLAYKAVETIELRTLNIQRMELVTWTFLKEGRVLSPSDVSKKEKFVRNYKPSYRINVNPPISEDLLYGAENAIADLESKKYCIIRPSDGIVVSLFIGVDATPEQAIKGLFEAISESDETWNNFRQQLLSQRWDLSVAFIDNVDYRLCFG